MAIWAEIFDGKYSVSTDGNVKNNKSGRTLKQYINTNGYCIVGIYNKDTKRTEHYRVHRLVATGFIPNPDNKRTVNHKDCDKTNNNVENLEWNTHSENIIHAVENGLRPVTQRQRDTARISIMKNRLLSNFNRKEICSIDSQGNIKKYDSIHDASIDVGVTPAAICGCLKGNTKESAGKKWRYVNEC